MSLRSFHIFFIVISILLSLCISIWGFKIGNSLPLGVIGLLALPLLLAYLYWFVRTKVGPFPALLFIFVPKKLFACAVCFGQTDSNTLAAVQNSLWFLMGLTALVLGLLSFFIFRIIRLANRRNSAP